MENLRDRLVPKTDLIPTDQLEEVIDDQLRPNMSANELLMLLRKDIQAMSKIANLMHLHELTAESLADLVLEAMVMLRAVPIVESTEMQLSIANGFRVGLAVRLDTFKSMLTERILYLSLSNSMFKFRRDDGEK